MTHARRFALVTLVVVLAAGIPVCGQSVVSTHSGLIYFFVGSVYLGDARLDQKFGRFPDVGEGQELRTALGRAEVLLTPGVFLRLDENSSIRMVSSQFADTRVELQSGSAILEVTEPAANTAVTLIYKNWQVRVPQKGVYRIDSEPPRIRTYQGEAAVTANAKTETVTVREAEVLPLAEVLVPEPSLNDGNDDFKLWAMSRSQAISADNTIAAGIVDDPNQMDNSGMGSGGYTYFPMTGIPSLDIGTPYGLSFWSPFQSTLASIYFPTYLLYRPLYGGWPVGWSPGWTRPYSGHPGLGLPIGVHPPRTTPPRVSVPTSHPATTAAPHVAVGVPHH